MHYHHHYLLLAHYHYFLLLYLHTHSSCLFLFSVLPVSDYDTKLAQYRLDVDDSANEINSQQ